MDHAIDRPVYQPSGRCDASRFVASVALLVACALGIVAIYCFLIYIEVYPSGLSVVFPAALAGGCARWSVKRGHWRNPALAGTLAMAMGLLGYLGYFHADQCWRWGVAPSAVDRLPGYIAFRMETDRWQLADRAFALIPRKPAAGDRPNLPLAQVKLLSWNWLGFAFETLILALVPLFIAFRAAGEPYSEPRRRWFLREKLTLAPDSVTALRKALANGTVSRWIDAGPKKVASHQPHETVTLWYTPAEADAEVESDVFVSLGKRRAVQLRPEEAAAFASLLPGVQDLAGPALSQLSAEAEEESFDEETARVWPVPPPYAGQVVNPGNRVRYFLLTQSLMLLPILLAALLPLGTYYLHKFSMQQKVLPDWAAPAFVVGYGLPCLVLLLWWFNPNGMVPIRAGNRREHRLMREAVASRPRPIVAANDPRAVFAEMVPRRFWSGNFPKCGDCNMGLMLMDPELRGIRFEGDYQNYWIPAAAIEACDLEAAITIGASATKASLWVVVLRVRVGGGTWEFPFYPTCNIEGRNRWERAAALLRKIEAISSRDFVGQPTVPPEPPGIPT